jgi:hypothetical protein
MCYDLSHGMLELVEIWYLVSLEVSLSIVHLIWDKDFFETLE